MRIRRSILIDSTRGQYFHVTSRVVDKRFIFGEAEKEAFLGMVRQYEGFSGVQVLSYCLMSNHFHLLIHVPRRPDTIPEEEVFRRLKFIYKKERIEAFKEQMTELEHEATDRFKEEFLDGFRTRMYHLSHFVRELKLRFSKYYNFRNDREGTLWEARFKCSLIEGHSNALMNTAAYIELNPVRAGIVDDPAQYSWCSYAEALAGGKSARAGLITLASRANQKLNYRDAIKAYRDFFKDKSRAQSWSKRGMTDGKLEESEDATSEAQSRDGDIIAKVRYFMDGVILGSKEFIEEWHNKNRDHLNKARKRLSNPLSHESMEGLHTYRKVD